MLRNPYRVGSETLRTCFQQHRLRSLRGGAKTIIDKPAHCLGCDKTRGILSRLASGLVDEEDVLDGPSGIANDHPVQIKVKKNGCSLTYYDDGISEEEIATFVGLYSNQGSKSVSCARWLTFILIQDP